jgi:DNA topoisomerase-1
VKIDTTVACDKCGSPMILRDSKRGPFLGCSSFPKCRSTKMMKKLTGADLTQVEALIPLLKEGAAKNADMIAKIIGANPAAVATRTGPITTDIDCDECGKPMMIRKGRRGFFLGCSGYPKCKNTASSRQAHGRNGPERQRHGQRQRQGGHTPPPPEPLDHEDAA